MSGPKARYLKEEPCGFVKGKKILVPKRRNLPSENMTSIKDADAGRCIPSADLDVRTPTVEAPRALIGASSSGDEPNLRSALMQMHQQWLDEELVILWNAEIFLIVKIHRKAWQT